jgi:hypothetical protein
VQTNRIIHNNKLDIIIRESEKGACVLVDVAIEGDGNVINKETENILKYKNLTIEIQRVWKAKRVMPVTIWASGTTSNSNREYPRNISGKHEIKELEQTAIWTLRTCFGRY